MDAAVMYVCSYLGAALLNHSCEPNCWTYFEGRTLMLRTLRPIQPGTHIPFLLLPY